MADKSYKSTLYKRAIDLGKITVGVDTDLVKVWRTSTGEEKAISLGDIAGGLIGDYVPYTGAVTNVNLGEYGLSTGYVKFDTSPTTAPLLQGTLGWADNRSTLSLIMNGTIQYVGQNLFFYVKNSTGSLISKGTNVGFAGTDGASGHILISKFLANGSSPSTYYMGVTSEDIGNGEFGQVMGFGELGGINTSGYPAGSLLYASTTVAGGFQITIPQAPNNIILVCSTLNSKNNGDIVIRPTIGSNINNDEGVKIISPTNGQALLYNSTTGLWENQTISLSGQVPINQIFNYTSSNVFSLSDPDPTIIYVTLNGQLLTEGSIYDYTVSGTQLTVTTPLLSGDEINVLYYSNLPSVQLLSRNIDGGSPDSVYLPIQNVDGGTP